MDSDSTFAAGAGEPDIAPLIARELDALLADAAEGHAVRVNYLEATLASSVIAHLLKPGADRQSALTAKILGRASSDDPLTIPTDKAIELRNRKQGVFCLFVPAEAHSGAASSLGNALAEIDGADLMKEALGKYRDRRNIDPAISRALSAIHTLYIQAAVSQKPATTDLLKFAVAATGAMEADPQAPIGLELWRIGLLPDAGADFVDRLRRNRAVVAALSRPRKITATIDERIAGLGLLPESERTLRPLLQRSRLEAPKAWTRQFAQPPLPPFNTWGFVENLTPSDCQKLTIKPFLDDRSTLIAANSKGLRQDTPGAPLWAEIGEKCKLTVKWVTLPAKTTVPRWRAEIVPAEDNDAWSEATIELPSIEVKRSTARTASLNLNLPFADEDDLPRIALCVAVRAIAETGEELESPDGTVLEARSEEFFLRKKDTVVEPPARERGRTAVTLPAGLLAYVAEQAADAPDPTMSAALQTSGQLVQHVFKVAERDHITITRSGILDALQAAILRSPDDLGSRSLLLEEPVLPAKDPEALATLFASGEAASITSDAGKQFLSARRSLFKRIGEIEGNRNRIELAPWAQMLDSAKRYTNAWTSWLETATSDELTTALQVDTLHVRIGDPAQVLADALIVAPTHPLRTLWFASQAALFQHWGDELLETVDTKRRARLIDMDMANTVQPINVPPLLHHRAAAGPRPFGRNLEAGFGVAFAEQGPDPMAQLTTLTTLLGMPTSAAAQENAPSERAAIALLRFQDAHPYADPLCIGIVNPGDGASFAGILQRWELELQKRAHRQANSQNDADDPRRPSARVGREAQPDDDLADSSLAELPALRVAAYGADLAGGIVAIERNLHAHITREATQASDHLRPSLALWSASLTTLDAIDQPITPQQHVTILHDLATPTPRALAKSSDGVERTGLELHGLGVRYTSQLVTEGEATQIASWINLESLPSAHPVDKGLSDAALRAHRAAFSAALRMPGLATTAESETRLALVTELSPAAIRRLRQIHLTSDWVITLDRFLGPELFDQPDRTTPNADVERTYILDATPDPYDGMGRRSFVTTASRGEIETMLRRAMGRYGFEQLDESVGALVQTLRTVSGRLVLDALRNDTRAAEVVGLGAVIAWLRSEGKLKDALIVPIDPNLPLFRPLQGQRGGSFHRCDLALVRFPSASRIAITLIEVKSRSTVGNDLDSLMDAMSRQMRETGEVFHARWGDPDRADRALQRAALARTLAFYLQRAIRFQLLDQPAFQTLSKRIASLDRLADLEISTDHDGYVIALDEDAASCTIPLDDSTTIRVLTIPQIAHAAGARIARGHLAVETHTAEPDAVDSAAPDVTAEAETAEAPAPLDAASTSDPHSANHGERGAFEANPDESEDSLNVTETQDIVLGMVGSNPVVWQPRVSGSPHMFIVGIPGQGKSVTTERVLLELAASKTPAFVLDFHGTLGAPESAYVQRARPVVLDAAQGLPFSPFVIDPGSSAMQVSHHAREIMNVVDHVFDLGTIQGDVFYKALQSLYRQRGYGTPREDNQEPRKPPTFAALSRALERAEKDNNTRNLLARTRMLFEFELFTPADDNPDQFDDLLRRGLVITLNQVGGDEIPLALSSFLLRQIYLAMIKWPIADRLRLVIVLDEAHRLAKDTTLPKIMKEGRKYGVAVVIASQSIGDFHPDIPANAGTKVSFRINNPESRKVAQYFGGAPGTDYAAMLENLAVGQAVVQTPDMPRALRTNMLRPSMPGETP
ncbi:MAG: ATP-binding protein [Thermomicrobiales bacterium]